MNAFLLFSAKTSFHGQHGVNLAMRADKPLLFDPIRDGV